MPIEPLSDALPIPIQQVGCADLFLVFSKMALAGFGGVLPFAYRSLVERHCWLDAAEFAELLGASQILPGPTICNLALMLGHRYAGTAGALSAMSGLIVAPFLIVIMLGVVYQHFGNLDVIRSALKGMAAVAAGLILATALKIAIAMFQKSGLRHKRTALRAVLILSAFVSLGLLHWRLILVFCALAPLGTLLFYLTRDER